MCTPEPSVIALEAIICDAIIIGRSHLFQGVKVNVFRKIVDESTSRQNVFSFCIISGQIGFNYIIYIIIYII